MCGVDWEKKGLSVMEEKIFISLQPAGTLLASTLPGTFGVNLGGGATYSMVKKRQEPVNSEG